ncbi:MAG TPA: hypothetical protein PKB15_02295 [Acidimicrobiia bacterium]|nr:hypothetical protein [Acidimicrobiia bacterium]
MAPSTKIVQSLDVPFVVAHDSDECSIEVGFEEDGLTPYIAIYVIDSDTDAFKECRVTGGVIEIKQEGFFRRDRWNILHLRTCVHQATQHLS